MRIAMRTQRGRDLMDTPEMIALASDARRTKRSAGAFVTRLRKLMREED